MQVYDYAIIGAGPGGMTLATLLPGDNILIEKASSLGGCHRVTRTTDGLFSEHSARIYSTTYINAISLFQDIGIDWNKHFVDYNFQFLSIGLDSLAKDLSVYEMGCFVVEFVRFMAGLTPVEPIGKWMNDRGFSLASQDTIDRVCRMTDGADKSRYLVSSFLSLFNENVFYKFQQPNKAMDKGLIREWEDILAGKVTILKSTTVRSVRPGIVTTDSEQIHAKTIIFAMPPQYIVDIGGIRDLFEDEIVSYAEKTKYIKYVSLTFHWKKKLSLDNIYGLTKDTKWGVVFIKLSDYIGNDSTTSTLFTIAVTKIDVPGLLGKTADESSDAEIKAEVWEEMNDLFQFPSRPDSIVIYHGDDKAFVETVSGFKTFENERAGVYAVSTCNGNSHYSFTSFESAVSNAIALYNRLTGGNRPIRRLVTVTSVLYVLLATLLLVAMWLVWKR